MENQQNEIRQDAQQASPSNTQPRLSPTAKTGFAIAALVLGVLGILLSLFPTLGGTCAVFALLFALICRKYKCGLRSLWGTGLGLAIAGLALFAGSMTLDLFLLLNPGVLDSIILQLEEYLQALQAANGQMPYALLFFR